ILGLYQGHIPANTLTFNPGWDQSAQPVDGDWDDIREIQDQLKAQGLTLTLECPTDGTGPAHIALEDPDGNAILIDQHR
ncbi:MAG: VOC family protein, partial [Pseudomonadota bacterium]